MSSRPTSSSRHEATTTGLAPTAMRRSFTLPSKLAPQQDTQQIAIGAAEGIETLFVHPSARVVSFSSASTCRSRPSSRSSAVSFDGERDGAGTLPWSSPTERTMAAGPLEIYRVPGSVAFLHSGNLLHAILPRSQCWCVDGVSIFAMRVLPNTYYRIELPAKSQDDMDLVEQLKTTFAKVLHYERTACPFERSFADDLPEMPSSHTRRMSRQSIEPAKRWTLNKVWRPEGEEYTEQESEPQPRLLRPTKMYSNYTEDTDRSENEETGKFASEENGNKTNEQPTRPPSRGKPYNISAPFLSKKMPTIRSITAPPQLSLHSSPPSKVRQMAGRFDKTSRDTVSTPSRASLTATIYTKLPPTPESMTGDGDFPTDSSDNSSCEHLSPAATDPDAPETENDADFQEGLKSITHQEPLIIVEQLEDQVDQVEPVLDTKQESMHDEKVQSSADESAKNQHEVDDDDSLRDTPQEHIELETTNLGEQNATPTMSTEEQPQSLPNSHTPSAPLPIVYTTTLRSKSSTISTTSSPADTWSNFPVLTPSEASNILRQRSGRSPSPSPSHTSTTPTTVTKSSAPIPRSQPTPTSQALAKTSPAILVRKTCALFLGPPAHLVTTMLRIAARLLASGALNLAEPAFHELFASGGGVDTARRGKGHRRVPGSWDLSDDDDDEDWGF